MIDQRYIDIYEEYQSHMKFYELMILIFVYEEQAKYLKLVHDEHFIGFRNAVKELEYKGLVKWHSENPEDITLRKIGEDLFKKHVGRKKKITTAKEVNIWIDSWRELFPKGVNAGGFRYRGDKQEVLKKMIKFVNDNDFTVEQIFQVTKEYIERYSLKGFAYMYLAHYFIEKKGVGSTLASECEGFMERTTDTKEKGGEDYGGAII